MLYVQARRAKEVSDDEIEAWEYWHERAHQFEKQLHEARLALTKLSNEVLGSLPLMEELCRREFGNTNYAILIQRAEEARAILGQQVMAQTHSSAQDQ